MPSAAHSWVAATVPKVSLSKVDTAPPTRATPDTRCWLEISRTAVVSDMPGISTISPASTTDFTASGTTKALITMAMVVATRAQIASLATARRGRAAERMVMAPITRPISPDTSRSAQELCSSRPTTQAADRP